MAEAGARVVIVEREPRFRDRVRGEGMHPWAVVEAIRAGVAGPLLRHGQPIRWKNVHTGPGPVARRDLLATTVSPVGALDIYHPAMQQGLLDAAAAAGAEVRRPAEVVAVAPGTPPEVVVQLDGHRERLAARLVVGADGRASRVRGGAGFPVRRDPECLVLAGVLHGGLALADDAVEMVTDWSRGEAALFFPLGGGRFRSYFAYRRQGALRPLGGDRHAADFVAACVGAGAPAEWFAHVRTLGPLASFDASERWVDHPCRDGVVLIGDAAAVSDPCFGCGMGLALRDVRVLRDRLLAASDWDAAAHAYAGEHDRYSGAMRTINRWMRDLFYERGPEADARRARALPRLVEEPDRAPDLLGLGPDSPADEAARRRFFGED
jgi:2-polyprenyl-6-methoxyphenol hydroxylase-like FAD-dependent oxidoreductase